MRTALLIALALAVAGAAGCLGERRPPETTILFPAHALLGPETDRIVVEIHHVPGHAPYPAALDTLEQQLRLATRKAVEIRQPIEIPRTGIENHSAADLQALHHATFTLGNPSRAGDAATGEAWLHILFVDGGFSNEGATALGVTLWHWSALFVDTIALVPDLGVPQWDLLAVNYEAVERAVLVHEVGHSLGLVGCGTPMVEPRQDPEAPCHSTDRGSVMWKGADTTAGWRELLQDNRAVPYRFTAQDLADTAAARNNPPTFF